MSKIIVITGQSQSGKTTLSKYINVVYGWPEIHPIEDMKKFFEGHYNLPTGSLDTVEGKAKVLNEATGLTGQQLLVDMWKYFKNVDPVFSTHYLRRELKALVKYSIPVVTNAIRSLPEVLTIFSIYDTSNVTHVHMTRESSYTEVSDVEQDSIFECLWSNSGRSMVVSNNGTLTDLYNLADEVVRRAS